MILYSRKDCPLCEDAEETLISLNLNYKYVDIDLDSELRKKYHAKVPVLINDSHKELTWPFSNDGLIKFARK